MAYQVGDPSLRADVNNRLLQPVDHIVHLLQASFLELEPRLHQDTITATTIITIIIIIFINHYSDKNLTSPTMCTSQARRAYRRSGFVVGQVADMRANLIEGRLYHILEHLRRRAIVHLSLHGLLELGLVLALGLRLVKNRLAAEEQGVELPALLVEPLVNVLQLLVDHLQFVPPRLGQAVGQSLLSGRQSFPGWHLIYTSAVVR